MFCVSTPTSLKPLHPLHKPLSCRSQPKKKKKRKRKQHPLLFVFIRAIISLLGVEGSYFLATHQTFSILREQRLKEEIQQALTRIYVYPDICDLDIFLERKRVNFPERQNLRGTKGKSSSCEGFTVCIFSLISFTSFDFIARMIHFSALSHFSALFCVIFFFFF